MNAKWDDTVCFSLGLIDDLVYCYSKYTQLPQALFYFLLEFIFVFLQDGIRREVQTMTLTNHPNLLRAHCSFTTDHSLWVVMPYMAGGSCLHIMKSSYTEGFEEPVIATLLREVLKALVSLHSHGHIHRDVKVMKGYA